MEDSLNKVGILTLNGYYNYGNRLQNYATQEILMTLGFENETILVDRTSNRQNISKRLYKTSSINELKTKISNRFINYLYKSIIKERKDVFIKFSKEHLNETDYEISNEYIPENLSNKYDYFITGSDQVWNPDNLHDTSFYFLTFAEKHKRIAYAPSFGLSELKPQYVDNYKKWISGMHRLSVREDDGARIIKNLIGKDVPVLVDPTLLLTKNKWLSIAKEANNKPKNKYLLTYFLGKIPDKYRKQLKNIAKENNLEFRNLVDVTDKDTYLVGPSEFIDHINSCSLFCTDSFHGTIFSILMRKPFIVYERMGTSSSMFSRINTLLNKFDFKDRKVENIKSNTDIFNIDYSHIPPILEAERNKSLNYLKEALGVKYMGTNP